MGAVILSADISSKNLGWAAGSMGARPRFGLYPLPGPASLGRLYIAVRNTLVDLIEEHRPAHLSWCTPLFGKGHAIGKALGGVAAVAELVAADNAVKGWEVTESHARKVILGRGSFGERDRRGKVIRGTGTAHAKAAVLEWCEHSGWPVDDDNIADALLLWSFTCEALDRRSDPYREINDHSGLTPSRERAHRLNAEGGDPS